MNVEETPKNYTTLCQTSHAQPKLTQCQPQLWWTTSKWVCRVFIGNINKIRDDLDSHEKYTPYSQSAVPPFIEFEPLQEIEVTKIVKSMATKSCEMDVLPTTLLKYNLDHLISVLTKLVNTSLKQGVYAKSWKTATIWPLLNKTGL